MSNNLAISCQDIRDKIKSFQEDLLSDDDYRNYVFHLENCVTCREYVGAIGSVSNQIWELGKLKIPGDLESTILFQYDKLKEQPIEQGAGSSRQAAGLVVAALLILVIIFLGISYFQSSNRAKEKDANSSEGISSGKKSNNGKGKESQTTKEWEPVGGSSDIIIRAPGG